MSIKPSDGLGDRLAKYRKLSGLSAQKLADRTGCGLTRGVIANIESGRKKDITVDQLIALSSVLGIPPVALALPLDTPNRFIRMTGQADESDERVSTRAWQAVEWFQGKPYAWRAVTDAEGEASALAYSTIKALSDYGWTHVAADRYTEEEQDQAAAALRLLGADLTDFAIDE